MQLTLDAHVQVIPHKFHCDTDFTKKKKCLHVKHRKMCMHHSVQTFILMAPGVLK